MSRGAGSGVRIAAGRWKGRRLDVPTAARPTSGRAREALFALLSDRLAGARVLDVFAGSGAVGLEAVSRGAESAVLVDRDTRALEKALARFPEAQRSVRTIGAPAHAALSRLVRRGERFDLIFCDPPYPERLPLAVAALLARLLAPDGSLVVQRDRASPEPEIAPLALSRRRAYGRNVFYFFDASRGASF